MVFPAAVLTQNASCSTVIRMTNGKIAKERDYFDNMEFMTQPGVMPPAQKKFYSNGNNKQSA